MAVGVGRRSLLRGNRSRYCPRSVTERPLLVWSLHDPLSPLSLYAVLTEDTSLTRGHRPCLPSPLASVAGASVPRPAESALPQHSSNPSERNRLDGDRPLLDPHDVLLGDRTISPFRDGHKMHAALGERDDTGPLAVGHPNRVL